MNNKIDIRKSIKKIDYFKSLEFMENKIIKIYENKENEMLWFLGHDHIYTCGNSSHKNEILENIKIPVIKTNRGGKTTYHGPGQRIVYIMVNLNNRKKDIRSFVTVIEKATISLLREFDIEAKTFPKRVGIWVVKNNGHKLEKEKKIGAIGIRIKKWITYHGLSFNINPNLNYYKKINACGLKNYSATSLNELGVKLKINKFDSKFSELFIRELKRL